MKAAQARRQICEVYGREALSKTTAKKWFAQFHSGNFDVADAPRGSRATLLVEHNIDVSMEIINQNRHINVLDVAQELNISRKSALRHLEKAGYKKMLNVWVPLHLKQTDLKERFSICESLLRRNEIEPFLDRLITADEKWITYNHIERKRTCSQRESNSAQAAKKGVLCVWWDRKGIVHLELLPPDKANDCELYCQQLMRLKKSGQNLST